MTHVSKDFLLWPLFWGRITPSPFLTAMKNKVREMIAESRAVFSFDMLPCRG